MKAEITSELKNGFKTPPIPITIISYPLFLFLQERNRWDFLTLLPSEINVDTLFVSLLLISAAVCQTCLW